MFDNLGDRMKANYEDRTRIKLPRRTNTIIRLDGKSFHTLTKGCQKPYDSFLMDAMDYAAIECCKEIQGAKLAFVQSDEISILLTDYDDIKTDAWFDGNVQKIVSVAASIVTCAFNIIRISGASVYKDLAKFDARAFTIPDPQEVVNYFVWRQQDATRNSISMAAQSMFSHKELNNKSCEEQQEMMFQKGVNWNDYPNGFKRGRAIKKVTINTPIPGIDTILRTQQWQIDENCPIFTQNRDYILKIMPQ